MIRPTSASLTAKIAVFVASLACAALAPSAVAAGATDTIHYKKESFAEYQQQLASGQVQAVTINRKLRSVRVTLKDGRYVRAQYALHEKRKVLAALHAKHVPVTLLTVAQSLEEIAKKPVHHKKRYIFGAILIVVIVLIGAGLFFFFRRRRAMAME